MNIKPSHRRRRAAANGTSTATAGRATRSVQRRRYPTIYNADAANACLKTYLQHHGRFDLMVADFPWQTKGKSAASKGFSSVCQEFQYPTMSPGALRAFDWGSAMKKDAIVGFWALNGQLDLALDVLRGQGFQHKQIITWVKTRKHGGLAHLPSNGPVINVSEMLIIAHRGQGLPLNAHAPKFKSVETHERFGHSVKPAIFMKMLAALYPETREGVRTRKLELFARRRAPGWHAWGNQAPAREGAATRQLPQMA